MQRQTTSRGGARRLGLVVAGSVLLWIGFMIHHSSFLPGNSLQVFLSFAPYLFAFMLFGIALSPTAARHRLINYAVPALLVAGIVSGFYVQVTGFNRGYGTDALALTHVAAEKILEGVNPYSIEIDVEEVANRFNVSEDFLTQTLDGKHITRLVSYPALHFLIFVPAIALGLDDLRWVVLFFQLASMVLLWIVARDDYKILALLPIVVNPDLAVYFTSGSVVDWLWVFPVMVSAVALVKGKLGWSAVAYGVAVAIKQQPWVLAPFLLIWLWRTTRGSGRERIVEVFRYGAVAGGVFLLFNLPFIVSAPTDWLLGTLNPLVEKMIPDGQGLSVLTKMGIMQLPKEFYLFAVLTVTGIALVGYYLYFWRVRHLIWIMPMVILWVSYRSFHNYFIYWIPMVILSILLEVQEKGTEDE